jgi:hypothetical protein
MNQKSAIGSEQEAIASVPSPTPSDRLALGDSVSVKKAAPATAHIIAAEGFALGRHQRSQSKFLKICLSVGSLLRCSRLGQVRL